MPTSLECDICAEVFNDTDRLPKVLPCQHTFCLGCILHIDKNGSITCPMDRMVFAVVSAAGLPENLYVKARLETNVSSDGERPNKSSRGSSDGDAVADANLQLQLLSNLAERREELLATLFDMRHGVSTALQERVHTEEQLLKRARDCIEGLQQQPSGQAQEQRREAASLLRAGAALEQDLQLLQPGLASVSAEGGWKSQRVQLSEQPALQLAALQLRQQDSLEWEPSQQEQQDQQEFPESTQCLDLVAISWKAPLQLVQEKQELLFSTARISVLRYVGCNMDPNFSLALLWKHAATLEEVHLFSAGRPHLQAVLGMPMLRKLQVRNIDVSYLNEVPALLAQLPHQEAGSGLTWLQLLDVPRETARSLIAANAHSLRKLRLGQWHGRMIPQLIGPSTSTT